MKLLKLLYIQTFMTNPQHSKHYKKTFHCETILPVLEYALNLCIVHYFTIIYIFYTKDFLFRS